MPNRKTDHTFVICAYGECPYLEACTASLQKQTAVSEVKMITSTPNDHIREIAEKYRISLIVNEGEKGITQDWNFALAQVTTRYATLAHQDDVYEPAYTQTLLEQMNREKHPIIGFTDYTEMLEDKPNPDSKLIRVKKILLAPLRIKAFRKSRWVRRRSLSLGCGICCPSVMFCMDNIRQPVFSSRFICCEDWEAWEKLSGEKGSFVFVPQPLIRHRIQKDAVTVKTAGHAGRMREDYEMFREFWPKWMADLLIRRYAKAEQYNRVRS